MIMIIAHLLIVKIYSFLKLDCLIMQFSECYNVPKIFIKLKCEKLKLRLKLQML